ncbi:hypothetical protein [Nocardioides sp. CER19]|nr:hypothetical protein [Nocardioides sp. CER19]MDH2413782.1 hypothetical protein [Nocardioides sp. CER19]
MTDAKHRAGRLPAWLPKTPVDRFALAALGALAGLLGGIVLARGL